MIRIFSYTFSIVIKKVWESKTKNIEINQKTKIGRIERLIIYYDNISHESILIFYYDLYILNL